MYPGSLPFVFNGRDMKSCSMYVGVQFGIFHCTNINNWNCVYHHFYRFIASRSQEGSRKCNMRNLRPSHKSLATVSRASVSIQVSMSMGR